MRRTPLTKKDLMLAIVLAVIFGLLAFGSINRGCSWGDDFAAYISEGIAIAENTLNEQAKINYYLHPAPLAKSAEESTEIVYAWGLPSILSIIYKIVGYDKISYDSIIYYKIPSVVCFSLLAGILFIFYRYFLNRKISLLLVVAFCTYISFYYIINNVMTDIVFLFMVVLDWVLLLRWREKENVINCVLLSVSLWFTYELRLNGIIVIVICLIDCIADSIKNKTDKHKMVINLIPYAVCAGLICIFQQIIGSATGESSIVGSVSAQTSMTYFKAYIEDIITNFRHVINSLLINPIYSLINILNLNSEFNSKPISNAMLMIVLLLPIIGITSAFKDRCLFLLAYAIVMLIGSSLYFHDERYIYPIMPTLYLYVGYGICHLKKKIKIKNAPISRFINTVALILSCALLVFPIVKYDKTIDINDNTIYGAYSDEAKQIYTYITQNTNENDVIAFFRPRCLYLNTGRKSFVPGMNDHSIDEANYFLRFKYEGELYPTDVNGMELILENDSFLLYKR